MNIHHLELFHYVAKHGGIAAAVRRMPYGIQQPAVSGQIARLEEALGAKLFNRRPFSLLPAGAELFEFIWQDARLGGRIPPHPTRDFQSESFLVICRYVFQDLRLTFYFAHRRAGRLAQAGCRFFRL